MANMIEIKADNLILELHKVALKQANAKVHGMELVNSLAAGEDNLTIKVKTKRKPPENAVKKYVEAYLKFFIGEETSKQLKDSDIKKVNDTLYDLKIDVNVVHLNVADDNGADDKDDSKPKKAKKKRFSIFSGAAKSFLNFARGIKIEIDDHLPIPIGKIIFGTPKDTVDTEGEVKKAFDDEFPNNNIDYKVLNSESVYNLLVVKYGLIDPKSAVCKAMRKSKYTFCGYVEHDDRNYGIIDEKTFRSAFSSLHFKPPVVHCIKNFDKSIFKNKNRNNVKPKSKIKKTTDLDELKTSLISKYTLSKKNLEAAGGNDLDDKLDKLHDDIVQEYKTLLNKKFNELIDRYKDTDDFDVEDKTREYKQQLSEWLQQFEDELDGGILNDDTQDLYVIPMTSKKLYAKIADALNSDK